MHGFLRIGPPYASRTAQEPCRVGGYPSVAPSHTHPFSSLGATERTRNGIGLFRVSGVAVVQPHIGFGQEKAIFSEQPRGAGGSVIKVQRAIRLIRIEAGRTVGPGRRCCYRHLRDGTQ